MKPEYEPVCLQQAVAYLIEECGEVLAAAGKTLRWGSESFNPELPPSQRELNRDWLDHEMTDLSGAVKRVRQFLAAGETVEEPHA